MKIPEIATYDASETYTWWHDLNNDFIRLNKNYLDYMRDLNSAKAEELMKTTAFLVFKDRMLEYLSNFVRNLQKHTGSIEKGLREVSNDQYKEIIDKVVKYELAIPRIDVQVDEDALYDKNKGCLENIYEWFVGKLGRDNEANKLFDATNEMIRKITRYAIQISEIGNGSANRKEEYAKISSLFLKCKDINEAHCLSAMVFGIEESIHLKGDIERNTDSYNSGVYEEQPLEIKIKPSERTYREKAHRSSVKDHTKEKQEILSRMIEQREQQKRKVQNLIVDGKIDFKALPVIEPEVREILLGWLSDAFENSSRRSKTEDGRSYHIDIGEYKKKCTVKCSDGMFKMPCLAIIFEDEGEK